MFKDDYYSLRFVSVIKIKKKKLFKCMNINSKLFKRHEFYAQTIFKSIFSEFISFKRPP